MTGREAFDRLPSLPSEITIGSAGLWAGAVLMDAALSRGWSLDDLRGLMLALAAMVAVDSATDERAMDEFRAKLDQIRADRAVKS